jgi:hypothetical protein
VPATTVALRETAGADGSGRSLKTQQRTSVIAEVDVVLGELSVLTARGPSKGSAPTTMYWRYP